MTSRKLEDSFCGAATRKETFIWVNWKVVLVCKENKGLGVGSSPDIKNLKIKH